MQDARHTIFWLRHHENKLRSIAPDTWFAWIPSDEFERNIENVIFKIRSSRDDMWETQGAREFVFLLFLSSTLAMTMSLMMKVLLPKLLLLIILRSNHKHGKLPRPWYLGITPDTVIFVFGISAETIPGKSEAQIACWYKSPSNIFTGKTGCNKLLIQKK